MNMEETARIELERCFDKMQTPAIEILEILRQGLLMRLSALGRAREAGGFPRIYTIRYLSSDLELVNKAIGYIIKLTPDDEDRKELTYDRFEEV